MNTVNSIRLDLLLSPKLSNPKSTPVFSGWAKSLKISLRYGQDNLNLNSLILFTQPTTRMMPLKQLNFKPHRTARSSFRVEQNKSIRLCPPPRIHSSRWMEDFRGPNWKEIRPFRDQKDMYIWICGLLTQDETRDLLDPLGWMHFLQISSGVVVKHDIFLRAHGNWSEAAYTGFLRHIWHELKTFQSLCLGPPSQFVSLIALLTYQMSFFWIQ